MTMAVLQSASKADFARFRRSTSLWLLMLSAPIAARYMISETQGEGINLAVGGQLPVLTSPVFGVWLGIVVSLFVMPVAFIYLRAGPTRRQPWQVTETTAANCVAIAVGRFAANSSIMLGILLALSGAGLFLAWLKVSGPYQPGVIILLAWIIALPTLLVTAALHVLFDARPWLRGALGDFLFFILWMTALVIPSAFAETPSTFGNNLASLSGAIRPLVESAPEGASAFAIGTSNLLPGRVELDPWRGITADGYIAARICWIGLAILIAAFAGMVYKPHKLKNRRDWFGKLDGLALSNIIPKQPASSLPAVKSSNQFLSLILTETNLIASQGLFPVLAIIAGLTGLSGEYIMIGSPVALLLMVFALTAYAGAIENQSMRALAKTSQTSEWTRRMAFVCAGTLLTTAMAVPASLVAISPEPILLGVITGFIASGLAIGLAAISGASFMPRIVMLIIWYGYFAG